MKGIYVKDLNLAIYYICKDIISSEHLKPSPDWVKGFHQTRILSKVDKAKKFSNKNKPPEIFYKKIGGSKSDYKILQKVIDTVFDLKKGGHYLDNHFISKEGEILIDIELFSNALGSLLENGILAGGHHTFDGLDKKYKKVYYDSYVKTFQKKYELFLEGLREGLKFPDANINDFDTFRAASQVYVTDIDLLKNKFTEVSKLIYKKESVAISEMRDIQEEAYKITVSPMGDILINGLFLSRPRFNEINRNIFEYIFNKKKSMIDTDSIIITTAELKQKFPDFKKNLRSIIKELGFEKQLKHLFFPNSTKSSLEFVNPITNNRLKEIGLEDLKNSKIDTIIQSIRKKRGNREK